MLIENLVNALSDIHLTESQATSYKKAFEEAQKRIVELNQAFSEQRELRMEKDKLIAKIQRIANEGLKAIEGHTSTTKTSMTALIELNLSTFEAIHSLTPK
jgi:ferritin-like metal-binding protein YciE